VINIWDVTMVNMTMDLVTVALCLTLLLEDHVFPIVLIAFPL
jgi:hypothetical protein